MRRHVSRLVFVKAGEKLAFTCTLPDGIKLARLGVWSQVGTYDISPYIPHNRLDTLQDGKPAFVQPTFFTLTPEHPHKIYEIVADETCMLCIRQEVDSMFEELATVKVKRHGNAISALGWYIRDAIGTIRSRAAARNRQQW